MQAMRTIRRYVNRKLYDTQESHYINLEQLASLIRAGEEIRVVSQKTGRDLTAMTLALILVEEAKRGKLAPEGFRRMIVSGLPVE